MTTSFSQFVQVALLIWDLPVMSKDEQYSNDWATPASATVDPLKTLAADGSPIGMKYWLPRNFTPDPPGRAACKGFSVRACGF